MNEEEFRALLDQLCDQYQLVKFESDFEKKFSAVVYCVLRGDTFDDQCEAFIERFSNETQTNWIILKRYGSQVRYIFRKIFGCQLSRKNKIKSKDRNYLNNIRDKECTASVDFKWKQVNRATCRNDPNLKSGLNCVINIKFDHSHSVSDGDALVYLRCSRETIEQFHLYFHSGMSVAAAKKYHEIFVIEAAEDENLITTNLANAQINPTFRQVTHLYNTWKKDHHHTSGGGSQLQAMVAKKEDLEKRGYRVNIQEVTLNIAIVTPLMKRVFEEFPLNHSGNAVFIDSFAQTATPELARSKNNSFLTFFFVASKLGALPLGCIIHTEKNIRDAFALLKETLEDCTKKKFCPEVIMAEDSFVQRIALQTVFPKARILLSASLVRQSVWKWLWMSRHNIKDDDRIPIMKCFQKVVLAPTIDSANEMNQELVSKVKGHPQASKYFEQLWFRRNEWCVSFRTHLFPTGVNFEDSEASIRIFKDVFLERCKRFNTCAMIDTVCSSFENYHKQRLGYFSSSMVDDHMSHYSKFCRVAAHVEIIEVGVNEYKVHSRSGEVLCTVNTDLAMCDCGYGRGGRYCEHLSAVEKKLNFWVNTRPALTTEDKELFSKLAFGPENFCEPFSVTRMLAEAGHSSTFSCENAAYPVSLIRVEHEPEFTPMTIKQEPGEHYLDPGTVDAYPLKSFQDEELDINSHDIKGADIKSEFNRVIDLLAPSTDTNAIRLTRFYRLLQAVKTPIQALQFVTSKVNCGKVNKLRRKPVPVWKNRKLPKVGIHSTRRSKDSKLKLNLKIKNSLTSKDTQNLHRNV